MLWQPAHDANLDDYCTMWSHDHASNHAMNDHVTHIYISVPTVMCDIMRHGRAHVHFSGTSRATNAMTLYNRYFGASLSGNVAEALISLAHLSGGITGTF